MKEALSVALKLPVPERAPAVALAFTGNPDLGAYAADMLRYYDTATRRFDDATSDTLAGGGGPVRAIDGPVAIGDAVGSYRVLRKLGQGGMGVVYLAEDERLGRQVALKFLAHDMSASVAESKAKLLAESRSAAVLNHPAIVTLHDVLDIGDELVTVMEYVEGQSLTDLIAAGPVALGYALRLTGQIADALAYAHGRGIAHCDLKPANIHVLPGGSPKILDFGLARALAGTESGAMAGPLFGTPGYLAPEQLLGRMTTAASDVYTLGVIFYQLLTGLPPFRFGDTPQLLLDTITMEPAPPSARVPGIPPQVDDLALRCLHKDPRQRLQPHELSRELTTVLSQLEPGSAPRQDVGSAGRGARRR